MGLLDDLQMGFGLKERTEDYDARTARTIAANEAEQAARSRGAGDHAAMIAGIRARQSYDPSQPTGQSEYYLNRAGGTDYRPAIAQDDRPFMQRLLFSPESAASPRDYAIGPLTMDQPLPKFGLLGLLSGLGGMFGRDVPTVAADASPMRVRPSSGFNLGGSAQEGTRFDIRTEAEPIDYSDGIPVQDPATIAATEALKDLSYLPEPDIDVDFSDFPASNSAFEAFIPSATTTPSYIPALQSMAGTPELDINFLENTRVPRAIDLERPLPVMPKDPTYYSGIDVDVPAIPTPDVVQLPNGLYFSRSTGKVFR
jgi:hypothetical protein